MRSRHARFLFLFILLIALGSSVGYAAVITVDGSSDDILGNLSGNGTCDLRESIEAANTDTAVGECAAGSGADAIEFASGLSGATIELTTTGNTDFGNSALAIDTDVTVRWLGADPSVTIARDAAVDDMRLFYVENAGSLTLQDLTFEDGVAQGGHGANRIAGRGGGGLGAGGAVFVNGGTLSVIRSTLRNNQALGGDGGDFASTAGSGGGGGSMVGSGSNNSGGAGSAAGAGAGGDGGGFTFSATCTGKGEEGGIDTPGIGAGGGGGGNCNTDPPSGNNAAAGGDGTFGGGGGGGGGLFCDGGGCGNGGAAGTGGYSGGNGGSGNVTISNSRGGGGGGGAGMGGAIFNNGGTVTITNSTLSGNSATGGAGGTGGAGNGTSGQGRGGGVFNRNGTLTVLNSTINGNTVTTSGGGIFNLGDSAVAIATLNNTIVANSSGGIDFDAATIDGGTTTTGGVGNLIESSSGFSGTIKSSSDPNLAALADNGGPTQTHAFAGVSPAIDTGNNAAASSLTSDQRGFEPRIFNGTVDIGAVEDGAVLSANFSINDRTLVEGDSGIKNFTFTVTLDNDVPGGATVDYASADNTATTADGDYTAINGTLTFAGTAGETQIITMNVTGDTVVEPDESFFVNLSNPSPATIGFTDSTGQANIDNDDAAQLSIDDVTLDEGDAGTTNFVFTVTLDNDVAGGVSVDYALAAGSATAAVDYTDAPGTLNFVGTAGETQTITVDVLGDAVVELDETFTVDLSNIVPAALDVTFSDDQGLGTIGNDDAATLSIDDVTLDEGDSGLTAFAFTVTLDNEVDNGLSVDFATADGTATEGDGDYTGDTGTLNFAGIAGETLTVTVNVNGDTVTERDETFMMDLSDLAAAGRDVTVTDAQGLGTIGNDDAATLSIDDVTQAEGDSGTTIFTFTVTLDNDVDTGLSVDVATTDGTATVADGDYVANSDTLNFVGSAGETQTLEVVVNGDTVEEAHETFTVDLSNVSAGGREVTLSDPQGLGTITSDDAAALFIDDVTLAEGDGGTTNFSFTVTRTNTLDPVSVDFTTADGTATTAAGDYTATSDTLTFVADGLASQTVTVEVNGDTVVELDEIFTVVLSNASGATIVDPDGLGTIGNDDAATLSIDDVTQAEGDSGNTIFTFTVTLDNDVDTALSIDVATTDGTATVADGDYVANSDTLNFSGSAGETQTVTVNVNGDEVFESDEDFTVDLSGLSAGGRDVTVSDAQGLGNISNDDVAKVQISAFDVNVSEDGDTDDYTVVLGEQPSDPVTISFATDAQLDPIDPLIFTSANWDAPQTVTVSAVDDGDVEGDHTSVIVHSVSSADPSFDGLDLSFLDVTASISDNDIELAFALGADSPEGPIEATPVDSDVVVLQAVVSSSGAAVDVTIETATLAIGQNVVRQIRTAFHRVEALKLYQDVNADGLVDAGDVLLGSGTSLDEATDTLLIALDQPLTITAGSAATVLFAYDFVDTTSGPGLPAALLIGLLFPFGLLLGRPRRRSLLLFGLLLSLVLAGCITQTIPPLRSVTYSSTLQQVTTDLDPSGPTLVGLPLEGADVSFTP